MRTGVVIAAALSLLLMSGVVFAQNSDKAMVLCNETMELSDEQCTKLMDLQTDLQMASIKIRAELKILELKISQELSKDDPNARELEDLVSKTAAARQELHKKRIDLLLKANTILEPEQWNRFRRCFESMNDPCFGMMSCTENDRCNVNCRQPTRLIVSGMGQCDPTGCVSTETACVTACDSGEAGGCCCGIAIRGMKDCSPREGSCRTIERRCVQIPSE